MSELSRELADYYARYGRHLRPYLLSMESGAGPHREKPPIDIHKTNYMSVPSTSKYPGDKISPGSKESSSGRFSENAEDEHIDYSLNKDGSPESSFTSRKLEWDSLADIGYNNSGKVEDSANKSLSTLERIALERHYKIAFSLDSSKKKATFGIKTKNSFKVGQPNAQSTPIETNIKVTKTNTAQNTKKVNVHADSNKIVSINPNPIIIESCLNDEDNPMSNKEIQTSLITNINTSSQTSERLMKDFNDIPIIITKPVAYKAIKSKNILKAKRKPIRYIKKYSPAKAIENKKVVQEAISSDKSSNYSQNKSDCHSDILSKADSFEFVPGYMYNKKNEILESKSSSDKDFSPKYETTPSISNDLISDINIADKLIDSKKMIDTVDNKNEQKKSPDEHTDYKSSILMINELVNLRHKDPIVKERLIKKLVKILANSDDDSSRKDTKITSDRYCQTEFSSRSKSSLLNLESISNKDDNITQCESIMNITKNIPEKKSSISTTLSDESISVLKSNSNDSLLKLLNSDTLPKVKKLELINDEIINLYRMKLNLENKRLQSSERKIETPQSKNSKENISNTINTLSKNDDLTSKSNSTPTLQTSNVFIPPLNLKSCSEDSQAQSLPIEVYSRSSSKKNTSSRNDKSESFKTSNKSNTTSETIKSSKSCVCSLRNSNLCQYCSKSMSLNSVSRISHDTSEAIKKIHNAYSKYHKCETMKSLMKEYDALVTKYKNAKSELSSKKRNIESRASKSEISDNRSSLIISKSEDKNPRLSSANIQNSSKSSSMKDPIVSQSNTSESLLQFQTSSQSANIDREILKQMANTMRHIESRLASLDIKRNNEKSSTNRKENVSLVESTKIEDTPSQRKECHSSAKCKCCLKKSLQSQNKELFDKYNIRHKKPIAYNLILQPSDSILNESHHKIKRKPLEQVIVKVPNKKNIAPLKKNDNRALLNPSIVISPCNDEENDGSTDDQLKEFSSLNDDYSINEVPNNTLAEYLSNNRPQFVHRANERREIIKEYVNQRIQRDETRRKLLIKSNVPNLKDVQLSELRNVIHTQFISKKRLFNSRDIVKNTNRQYKKLSEVQMRKEVVKKNEFKRTNRLMAEIFVKQLRQKALKGIVNFSHNSIITVN